MSRIPEDLEVSIDLAARDIARAASECFGPENYQRILSNVMAMTKAAVLGSAPQAGGWTDVSSGWARSAADPGMVDGSQLSSAAARWWDTLDDAGKVSVIMGPAGHHKSEFVNNLVQKYQGKPESVLMRDIPGLYDAYTGSKSAPTPGSPEQVQP